MSFSKSKKLTATILTVLSLFGGTVIAAPVEEARTSPAVEQQEAPSAADEFLEALGVFETGSFNDLYKQAMSTKKFHDAMGESNLKKFEKFHDLLVGGKTEEAIKLIRSIEHGQSGWIKDFMRIFRGIAYLFEPDFEKTIADSTKDINKDGNDYVAYMTRMRAYVLKMKNNNESFSSENMTLALADLEKSMEFADEEEIDLYRMVDAFARMQRQEYTKALELTNILVKKNPQDADYLVLRAGCYEAMDVENGVMRGYNAQNGLKADPHALADGKEKALADLDKAILLDDSFAKRMTRARLRSEVDDFDGAWRDMDAAESLAKKRRDYIKVYYQTVMLSLREKNAHGTYRGEPLPEES